MTEQPSLDYGFDGPSLLSPSGGEIFEVREITIEWMQPVNIIISSEIIWYELLFVDSYNKFQQNKWVQIANLPKNLTFFVWSVPPSIKSNNCRIGVRAVNYKGERSKISFSPAPFVIKDKEFPPPVVFEPTSNSSYFAYVPIILDYEGLRGQCSQRAFYKIQYMSEKQNIDWVLISHNIPIDSKITYWNVNDLPVSDDYILKIELVDGDAVSIPVFITNLKISNLNYFKIDTTPPKGDIKIIDNKEYTNERNLILNLQAYDETSGVESFRIEQVNISSGKISTTGKGEYQQITDLASWYVEGNDGIKLIQSRFRDVAGNIVPDNLNAEYFRTYMSLDNVEVSAILPVKSSGSTDLWIAFGNNTLKLYKNIQFICNLLYEVTSMIDKNDVMYIAARKEDNKGLFQKYSGSIVQTIAEFDKVDSVINSMEIFDDKIFLGMENGELLSYNENYITVENKENIFLKSISYLKSFGNILLIFFNNSEIIITMNKNEQNKYEFSNIDM